MEVADRIFDRDFLGAALCIYAVILYSDFSCVDFTIDGSRFHRKKLQDSPFRGYDESPILGDCVDSWGRNEGAEASVKDLEYESRIYLANISASVPHRNVPCHDFSVRFLTLWVRTKLESDIFRRDRCEGSTMGAAGLEQKAHKRTAQALHSVLKVLSSVRVSPSIRSLRGMTKMSNNWAQLKPRYAEDWLVLFLGAGISIASGIPPWSNFICRLMDSLPATGRPPLAAPAFGPLLSGSPKSVRPATRTGVGPHRPVVPYPLPLPAEPRHLSS